MSKMDNLRAMREAKYEAQKRAGAAAATARPRPSTKPSPTSPQAAEPVVDDAAADSEELCGHRNMSGRTCTRERGHSAKSHRYS